MLKSQITFISDIPDIEKETMIEIYINNWLYYLQIADTLELKIHNKNIEPLPSLNTYNNMSCESALLALFSEYFCKYGDIDLLDNYLRIIILNQASADELPHITLDDCDQCRPELVIQRINNIPAEYHELLMNSLWSRILKNKIYNESDSHLTPYK